MKGNRIHANACKITVTKLCAPDHTTPSGMCAVCVKCGLCEVGKKAKTGRTVFPEPFGVAQFSAEKRIPFIQYLQILPEIIGEGIVFKKVKSECNLGGFKSSSPLICAAMGSTKVAHNHGKHLAEGSALAGIPMVVGENVLITHGEKALKGRMKPYLDNYHRRGALVVQANANELNINVHEIGASLGAHAIELKIGQGCKSCFDGYI